MPKWQKYIALHMPMLYNKVEGDNNDFKATQD